MDGSSQGGETGKGLTSNAIKLIAIAAMTLDHVTWLLFPGCQHLLWVMGLHLLGRITAPIMWFFLAEGFHYTRNPKKYAGRLFLFAVISHFAYNFAGGISLIPSGFFNQTSVMWSLAWSVVLMMAVSDEEKPLWQKLLLIFFVCLITFPADWSCVAAMCPVFLYSHRGDFKRQCLDLLIWTFLYGLVYFAAMDPAYGVLQLGTLLSIPILRSYNGSRGRGRYMKWLFYIYYPAHLFLLGILRLLMGAESIFP